MNNKQSSQEDLCSKCLRNIKGVCAAFKMKHWPCWAYIDNTDEFDKREKERNDYLEKHDIEK